MIEIATSMCASSQKNTLEHVQSTHLMALLPTFAPLSFGFQHPNGGLQLENVQNVVVLCVCVCCVFVVAFVFLFAGQLFLKKNPKDKISVRPPSLSKQGREGEGGPSRGCCCCHAAITCLFLE